MKPALLDVNVLLALAWPNHQFHARAHEWFSAHSRRGWATCALTQLGFVRLSSNPSYTPAAVLPQEAAALLAAFVAHKAHVFWQSPPAVARETYARALGHQQVNDAYLVQIARANEGRLVTFDTRLRVHASDASQVSVIAAA